MVTHRPCPQKGDSFGCRVRTFTAPEIPAKLGEAVLEKLE
jgi:hypothetical protein